MSVGVAGRPFLTVLTAPVQKARTRWYRRVRRSVRPLVKPGVPLPKPQPYPGHESLVRSVVEGLRAISADFNFNPERFRDIGHAVYAPANEALAQAIALKREGRIEFLAAGPVNALFPDESGGIMRSPEIDIAIAPSEWVRSFYRDEPELGRKVRICPAGVDQRFWERSQPPLPRGALVYWKHGAESFCVEVEAIIRKHGLEPRRLTYGAYDRASFKAALSDARVAVFLSSFETQGLALAEAWSMDVPTIVWDPRGQTEWNGRAFVAGSSCPYLTAATGRAWQTGPELDRALSEVIDARTPLAPRAWVLANMTDAVCADRLYRLIQQAAAR